MSETFKVSSSDGKSIPLGTDAAAEFPAAPLPSDSLYQFAAMAVVLFLLATIF